MPPQRKPQDEFNRWCEARGLSGDSLAELFGVSRGTIYFWRCGRNLPSVLLAARIEKITLGAVPMRAWVRGTDWELD